MVSPSVRRATPEDARELARLRWDFRPQSQAGQDFAAFAEAFEEWLEAALSSGRWMAAVADEGDGHLVGCMFLQSVRQVPDPGAIERAWGYLTHCYVAPGHRGRGIGRQLLDAVASAARALGHAFVIVWPSEESVSLYARAGFREVVEAHAGPDDHPPLELILG